MLVGGRPGYEFYLAIESSKLSKRYLHPLAPFRQKHGEFHVDKNW